MCYSALVKKDLEYLRRRYGAIAVREQFDNYARESLADPKAFPELNARIYPGHYAPVIFERNGKRVTELMRYGAYPPTHIKDPKKYTTFNARRDNLTSAFWSEAFMRHHGFIVLEGFYEWVAVRDLLKAKVVTLRDVELEFKRQSAERKDKILAAGKTWKPTPTEKKPVIERQIIIQFSPEDREDLIAPVIFSYGLDQNGNTGAGFAIVTDDPTPEIHRAGHDRCPVIMSPDTVDEWLHFDGKTPEALQDILTKRRRVTFKHGLPIAA